MVSLDLKANPSYSKLLLALRISHLSVPSSDLQTPEKSMSQEIIPQLYHERIPEQTDILPKVTESVPTRNSEGSNQSPVTNGHRSQTKHLQMES